MNTKLFSVILAATLTFGSPAFAGASKTYQATGPVLEINDSMIAVQKGKERWEMARDASTNGDSAVKVGDKVTVTYTMTATKIEGKGAAKGAQSASPSPASSPTKK